MDTPHHALSRRLLPLLAGIALLSTSPAVYAADESDDAAPQNVVQVINTDNNQLRVDGDVQLNRIPGQTARPLNEAVAYSSCTDCQTFAVALQIDLISKSATDIRPENYAIAVNYQCTRCTTVADAYQYVIQVDDPRHFAWDISDRVHELNDQLRELRSDDEITAAQVQTRIDQVISRFQQLALSLTNQQDEHAYVRHDEEHD